MVSFSSSHEKSELILMFQQKSAAYWVDQLGRSGVPVSLVRNMAEVVADEHSTERELFPEVEHQKAGKIRVTGLPVKFSDTPGKVGAGAPELGRDTVAVLRDLLGDGSAWGQWVCGQFETFLVNI